MSKYKKLVHFGDSFTFGQDSGGDDIDDYNLSYPAHLSELSGIPFDNFATIYANNDTLYLRIFEYLRTNRNPDELIVANLTTYLRMMTTVGMHHIDRFHIAGHVLKTNTLGFNEPLDDPLLEQYHNLFIYEEEQLLIMNGLTTIYSIVALCKSFNVDVIFIDMFFNFKRISEDYELCIKDLEQYIASDLAEYHSVSRVSFDKTKSGHFYSNGYNDMAKFIYNDMTKKGIL